MAFVGLSSMSTLGSHEKTITHVAARKVKAGDDVRFADADMNGWQTAYVLDHGKSRKVSTHCESQCMWLNN